MNDWGCKIGLCYTDPVLRSLRILILQDLVSSRSFFLFFFFLALPEFALSPSIFVLQTEDKVFFAHHIFVEKPLYPFVEFP